MQKHAVKNCSKCQAAFECKAGSITQCQCFGISFSEAERRVLENACADCLCCHCLTEIKKGFSISAKPLPLPEKLPDA
jgi:hypothetical protein